MDNLLFENFPGSMENFEQAGFPLLMPTGLIPRPETSSPTSTVSSLCSSDGGSACVSPPPDLNEPYTDLLDLDFILNNTTIGQDDEMPIKIKEEPMSPGGASSCGMDSPSPMALPEMDSFLNFPDISLERFAGPDVKPFLMQMQQKTTLHHLATPPLHHHQQMSPPCSPQTVPELPSYAAHHQMQARQHMLMMSIHQQQHQQLLTPPNTPPSSPLLDLLRNTPADTNMPPPQSAGAPQIVRKKGRRAWGRKRTTPPIPVLTPAAARPTPKVHTSRPICAPTLERSRTTATGRDAAGSLPALTSSPATIANTLATDPSSVTSVTVHFPGPTTFPFIWSATCELFNEHLKNTDILKLNVHAN